MDDAILWREFRLGDEKAFETIFVRYHHELFLYGNKMVRDRQLLDDSIQELFLELWEAKARLTAVVSIKAYLFRALKYKLLHAIRREMRQEELSAGGHEIIEFSYEAFLVEEQTDLELKQNLLNQIRKLTRRQQEVLYLRFYSQMSYEEISEVLSISYQAVVNLVYKSVKALRENMIFLWALVAINGWQLVQ